MKNRLNINTESGTALICALGVIVVVSLIGASVLRNCMIRYNATSKPIKGWKEALYAAEAGGDIAFAEIRKKLAYDKDQASPKTAPVPFATASNWQSPAPAPKPTPATTLNPPPESWAWGFSVPSTFGLDNSLSAKVTVDQLQYLDNDPGRPIYRIRSIGTAKVAGLRRTGMDDAMEAKVAGVNNFAQNASTRGVGNSLLRKIDYNVDHFLATYGDGDGNNRQIVNIPTDANGQRVAQASRRIELIAVPIMPIEAAIKVSNNFSGPGSAGRVDSYDSRNGVYNSSAQLADDLDDGDVACGGSAFSQGGFIDGDVSTNGGTAQTSKASGVVDNNVAFTIDPQPNVPVPQGVIAETGTPHTISPGYSVVNGVVKTEFWYTGYSSVNNVVVNPVVSPGGDRIETLVHIRCSGDVTKITVNKGAAVRAYFQGNMNTNSNSLDNNNVDGLEQGTAAPVVKMVDPQNPAGPLIPSTKVSRTGHLHFIGVSPPAGQTRTISIGPGGGPNKKVYAQFTAPGHDFSTNGNVDFWGAWVFKSFSSNGNNSFYYDKQLGKEIDPQDYRIASYVEDIR